MKLRINPINFRTALLLVVLLEVAIALLGIVNYGVTLEGLQATTRFSGRLSLVIFSFIFLFSNTGHLRSGLSSNYFFVLAVAHGIHLLELLSFVYLSGTTLIFYRVAGGFFAYALIFAMPWFQHLFRKEKLTENQFSILATVYGYYVWFIFFLTYLPRVLGKVHAGGTWAEHAALLTWIVLMLGIKMFSGQLTMGVNRN